MNSRLAALLGAAAAAVAALCTLASLRLRSPRRPPRQIPRQHAAPSEEKRAAISRLRGMARTEFDPDNPEHAALLTRIAVKYGLGSEPVDWTQLGFQRRASPATDLRAMGVLGLHVMEQTESPPFVPPEGSGVPPLFFALELLRVSHDVLKRAIQDDAYLATHFASLDAPAPEGEARLRADVAGLCVEVDAAMAAFESFWIRRRPPSVMDFETVYKEFLRGYR